MKKILLLLLFVYGLYSCEPIDTPLPPPPQLYCATKLPRSVVEASEAINNKDRIIHRIRYHYFTNGSEDIFSDSFFYDRTHVLNHNYKDTRRQFIIESVTFYDKKPEDYPRALKVIEGIESIKPRKDLREAFIIEQFAFWGKIFESDNAIDIFVYDKYNSGYAGVALAIQSKIIAVRYDYMDPIFVLNTKEERNTLEHEIGHALGLKHTHHDDKNVKTLGFDRLGDGICDTPKTPEDLFMYINSDCEVQDGIFAEGMPKECIENSTKNFMSYTLGFCRSIFTEDQTLEMDAALETNRDLRSTCVNFDLNNIEIPDLILIK